MLAAPKLRLIIRHSAASKDAALAEELRDHLRPLERSANLDVWSEACVRAGADTRREIERAIDQADVALLLLSPDFLASDALQVELPRLLERHRDGKLQVVPVLLRSCLYEAHIWLSGLKLLPRDGKAIASHQGDERDRVLTELVRELSGVVPLPASEGTPAEHATSQGSSIATTPSAGMGGSTFHINISGSTIGGVGIGDGAIAAGRIDMTPPSQRFQPQSDVELTLHYTKKPVSSSECHWYTLKVNLKNLGRKRLDDWEIEVTFPTPLLDGTVHAMRVAERSNAHQTLFRHSSTTGLQPIRPADHFSFEFGYHIDDRIYSRRDELFPQLVKARALVNGEVVAEVERPLRELQCF
ncbi:toll/interleukin-1 receptor domain-containing protein [Sorangium sp. So ce367]|uniref:toll/interleukin-1 receptor domain-containing protein n=1 Tax=Sorangium sp. So ce367 TaxID=3133305 RepID=UPI003F63BDC0